MVTSLFKINGVPKRIAHLLNLKLSSGIASLAPITCT